MNSHGRKITLDEYRTGEAYQGESSCSMQYMVSLMTVKNKLSCRKDCCGLLFAFHLVTVVSFATV